MPQITQGNHHLLNPHCTLYQLKNFMWGSFSHKVKTNRFEDQRKSRKSNKLQAYNHAAPLAFHTALIELDWFFNCGKKTCLWC